MAFTVRICSGDKGKFKGRFKVQDTRSRTVCGVCGGLLRRTFKTAASGQAVWCFECGVVVHSRCTALAAWEHIKVCIACRRTD